MKLRKQPAAILAAAAVLSLATMAHAQVPKYVFFFLGDGMANSQIQATEAYLTTVNGGSATEAKDLLLPGNRLNMSKMAVAGMQTTFDAHALMTDSASAGTAFACGIKTKSGVIGMDDSAGTGYKSVAQLAHESGYRVGILSSVSLDHATPAAYYASVANRGYMNDIASQLAETGYEFFGGGGLVSPTGPARSGDTSRNVWDILEANGYTVLNDRASILALEGSPMDKVVCFNPELADGQAMPYDIDRRSHYTDNLSLAEMTEVAIANLYKGGKGRGRREDDRERKGRGFFIMVEGGKIDWACHANDAMAAIGDMLDFDAAIGKALEFYRKHPRETLVIVTGDHETGGMSIGHATTAYKAHYDRLLGQTNSFQHFGESVWPDHEALHEGTVCPEVAAADNLERDADMRDLMQTRFGLAWSDLNAYQKEKLEDAYDLSMCETNDNTQDENAYLYGGYEPIIVTITHILNERASIGWTSYSHTGVPVPVFAEGRKAELFAGFYDNTDIAAKLAEAMKLKKPPVEK